MKKILSLLLFMLLVSAPVFANQAKGLPNSGFITVTASRTEEVKPNLATISFYIETSNKVSDNAVKENKKLATDVIEAIRAAYNPDLDTLKTTSYNVVPSYIYHNNNKKTLDKYVVTTALQFTTKAPSTMGTIINAAQQAGVTRVSGLNYSLDMENFDCSDIIKKAAKNLRHRADAAASAIGVKVTGVKEMNVDCGGQNAVRYYAMAKSTSYDNAVGESTPVPLQEGVTKVTVTITAKFWVK